MSNGKLPETEQGFLGWSRTFTTALSEDPESFGVPPEQSEAYAVRHQALADAIRIAADARTRTPISIKLKREALTDAMRDARRLISLINGHPGLSEAQRMKLGMPIRKPPVRRIEAPSEVPNLSVADTRGHTVHLVVRDGRDGLRPRKAEGAAGAHIYLHVGGDEAPARLDAYTRVASVTRTNVTLTLDTALPPGTRVWMCAAWFNARAETGNACKAVSTYIQYGGPLHFPQLANVA